MKVIAILLITALSLTSSAGLLREFLGLPESKSCDLEKVMAWRGSTPELLSLYNGQIQNNKLCDASKSLVALLRYDELVFVQNRLAPHLLRNLIYQRLYIDAIEYSRNLGLSRIQPLDREEFEYLTWLAHAFKIPAHKNVCTENPVTRRCDEGQGLSQSALQFLKKYPHSQFEQEMKEVAQQFYLFESQHEMLKLKESVAQYQNAVHPVDGWEEFLVNFVRGNNRRDDGRVLANCVGSGGGDRNVSAKCDLVYKHALLARVLNQALHLETLLIEGEKNDVYQVLIIHLTELKNLVLEKPELRREIFPTYQRMDFDAVIARYRARLSQ